MERTPQAAIIEGDFCYSEALTAIEMLLDRGFSVRAEQDEERWTIRATMPQGTRPAPIPPMFDHDD